MLLIIIDRPMNKSKFRALSNICGNFSEVFLASVIIPIFKEKFDLSQIPVLIFGVVTTFISIYFSLKFAHAGKL